MRSLHCSRVCLRPSVARSNMQQHSTQYAFARQRLITVLRMCCEIALCDEHNYGLVTAQNPNTWSRS